MFEFRPGPGDMTPVCCLLAGSSGGFDRCEEDEDVDADEDEEDSNPKSACWNGEVALLNKLLI